MSIAIRKEAATFVRPATFAATRLALTDRECAESFTATVLSFSAADLARAAHRTKAAAKGWKDASRAPTTASIVNMARALPQVRDWLLEQIGVREAQAGSVDAVIHALYAIAAGEGEEAHKARQMIWRLHQEPRE